MTEPAWLERIMVDAIHDDQIRQHGGGFGTRDEGLLESALARPRQKWAYEPGADIYTLAAAYGFGLARNHGYVDGNKRVAYMAMYVFLGLNGLEIEAPEPEVVMVMTDVATGERDETALALWLRQSCVYLTE